ncbi:MAG: hypothetical protein ACTSQY_00130 [Candidatus Odinarchaeia archaeon]|nr:MAG: hypothetical protein [Lokiarchaeota virus Fenrir Meg22_1012]URC17205.1 MAG: hypothetical protein [Lokiarchaeota virus Fenrir Meg22_1214]
MTYLTKINGVSIEILSKINGISKDNLKKINSLELPPTTGWFWRDVSDGWDYSLTIDSYWHTLSLTVVPDGTVGVIVRFWANTNIIAWGVRKDGSNTASILDGNRNANNYVIGMLACTSSKTIQYNIIPNTGATEAYLSILAYKIV